MLHSHKVLKHIRKRYQEIQKEIDETTMNVINVTIYKNHNRFRNDKGFKGLKMLQKTYKKLKSVRFEQCIQIFMESLPLASDLMSNSKSNIYLPVKSSLEYFLVIHMKLFKICERIHGLSQHTKRYLLFRIKLGHFWDWATFNLANVSRLW